MKQEVLETGCFYHIYNRGNNSEDIFKDERNYRYFLELLNRHILPIADIYAYCLLKNHFHLLVRIKDEPQMQTIEGHRVEVHLQFSKLFNAYAKAINKASSRKGSLFQKPFKRKKIAGEEYLRQTIAYIHLNPFKHGFTLSYETYPHSSILALNSLKPTKLHRREVLDLFDGPENFRFWHNQNYNRILMLTEEFEQLP